MHIYQELLHEPPISNQSEFNRISTGMVGHHHDVHSGSPDLPPVSHSCEEPMTGSSSQGEKRKDRPETEDKREKMKRLCMKYGISGCPGASARK
jgi:hypothetical protein